MKSVLTTLPPDTQTIAELRELYRAAESRASRLRLLSTFGQELALSTGRDLDETLQRCARMLAFFLGSTSGQVDQSGEGPGIPVPAPGATEHVLARLVIKGIPALDAIADVEDRDTCRMCAELIGATIDRIMREEERANLIDALSEREQRLETLVGRIFTAQEDERRRVSRELHDGVAQTATALVRMLEGSGTQAGSAIADAERARFSAIARDLLKELRAVIGGLRPTLLDDLGLAAAMQALAEGLKANGYDVTLRLDSEATRLPPHVETALFRVAQEAIANIRKHAGGPCPVTIALVRDADRSHRLHIADGGCGLAPGRAAAIGSGAGDHIGIDVMRERMAAIGGTLLWGPTDDGGVGVTAIYSDLLPQ